MSDIKLCSSFLKGDVTVCSSKSIAHRAMIIAALSGKDITIENVDYSKDIEATMNGLKALGVNIEYNDATVKVKKSNIIRNSKVSFNAMESGSTLRFLIPLFVALNNETVFLGEGRLPKRPLDDYLEIFKKEQIEFEKGEDYLPLKTKGTFKGDTFSVRGNISSQFITGLMLFSVAYEREVTINITTPLESKPYVEITKKVLEDFGHEVYFNGNTIKVKKGTVNIDKYIVENDWSQAAFFMAGGAINGDVTLLNMNPSSMQGDKQIINILKNMNADITVGKDLVNVKKSRLLPVRVDASQIPDLVPILSVLCAKAKGESLIYNIERLRVKESDRILSTSDMLNKAGVKTEVGKDYLKIFGGEEFKSCTIDSYNDHRIVMSSAILALDAEEVVIKNCRAFQKSYPEFFKDYFNLGGKGEFLNE